MFIEPGLCSKVTEVFVHDPLYNWSLTPSRAQQSEPADQGSAGTSFQLICIYIYMYTYTYIHIHTFVFIYPCVGAACQKQRR